MAWVNQMPTSNRIETTPMVVDGVMYVSEPPSNVYALMPPRGGRTGTTSAACRAYQRLLRRGESRCCRAWATAFFVGTVDAHLVALHAKNRGGALGRGSGRSQAPGTASRCAPLIVKDMVVTGIAGGEYGIRGFLDAYDIKTGKRRWRF